MFARYFSAISLGFLVTLAALAPSPAFAQERGHKDGVQPLDRLLPGIRRSHPGDFYDAEGPTYGPSGDPHYHLKWMTPDGRVIWYDTDARSGRVLRSSPGRDGFDGPRNEGGRPYMDRYRPYTAEPYDRGYGRSHDRGYGPGPGPGYVRPWRDGGGRGWRR